MKRTPRRSRSFPAARGLLKIVLVFAAVLAFAAVATAPAPAQAARHRHHTKITSTINSMVLVPMGAPPLSDAAAAAHVRSPGWEPRPENSEDNQRVPTRQELELFHKQNQEPYSKWVNGDYRGTTDQIIQWAAYKWGLNPDLLRSVAAVETWWYMSYVGDEGSAFGLFQVRTPYHCQGSVVCGLFRYDTAFNADYYASIIRSYYDGQQGWLNTVSGNGQAYRGGDIWGALGYWASGRWHVPAGETYVDHVKEDLAQHVWEQPYFVYE